MDFSRNSQPVAQSAHAPAAGSSNVKRGGASEGKWEKVLNLVLAVAIVVLLLATVLGLATKGNGSDEAALVNKDKLQAVFLNTGQVYFGNVDELNSKYFVVSNIYYLQTSSTGTQQNASTSVSLVKLGCELHEPFDKMVINRDQVTFWENLQDGGQVAKAVATFEKQNPNGQKCTDQSSSASAATSNSVQNAGQSTTPTTKP